jgi:murein DD-endopeptidase MepM/ murein hydrolase activator NlpD
VTPPAPVPQPGQHGLRIGEGAPTGRARLISVGERLFAPLAGLTPPDVLRGGYGFLDPTDYAAGGVPQTLHPGADLNAGTGDCNADAGLDVVAPLAGIVRAALPWDGSRRGEGNHLWLELTDEVAPGPTWLHVDHLQAIAVHVGQRVAPGERLGWCGATGGWACAHLHLELLKGPPAQGFWQWPYQWTRAQVEAAYYRPLDWWNAASARVQGAPEEAVVALLSGAQTAAVQAVMWNGQPFNPDAAIAAAWRDEWHRGVWRGRALSPEELVPEDPAEGKPAGAYQLFEDGCCVWLPGAPASWNG